MTTVENLVKEIMLSGAMYSITGADGSEVRKIRGATKDEAVTILLAELEQLHIQRYLNAQEESQ